MTDVGARVIAIIAEKAVVDARTIGPETRMDHLGLDSLGMVESIFAVEEAFAVSVPFSSGRPGQDDAFNLSSVGAIITAVETLLADKA
ncbi:MAG: acyl carrier protein [Rhodobacteraceae bacterium]|nr:acyl carrier protein [Paracoccaceae bacterium]